MKAAADTFCSCYLPVSQSEEMGGTVLTGQSVFKVTTPV